MSNISSLKNQAQMLLERLNGGKKFLLKDVNERMKIAAETYPQDTVVRAVSSVIERMYKENPEAITSQAEVENIYQELIGLNASGTRFREIFGDLLKTSGPKSTSYKNEEYIAGIRDNPEKGDIHDEVNPVFSEDLGNIFKTKVDTYDPQRAANAKDKVGLELKSLGFSNSRVRLVGGNSRFLVFATDLDTNRGAKRVFIPTEASGEKLPSIFVAGNNFATLTQSNLKDYLVNASVGNDQKLITTSSILNTLDELTGNTVKTAEQEEVDKITSMLPSSNHGAVSASDQVYTNIEDAKQDIGSVEIPRAELPEPLKMVAEELEESVLEAAVGYPQASVRLAKRIVVSELSSMGFKGTQVRISAPCDDGFICEATINTPKGKVSIEVPIEMKGSTPLLPSVFAKNDFIDDFTKERIHAFAMREAGDDGFVRRNSPLLAMSVHELREIIIKSATSGDINTCDEVIKVIAERFDDDTYCSVVSDYQRILSNVVKAKNNLSQSFEDKDQFIKTPNSMYPIHKKLGRPAHELVRDENGEYHLKASYYARQQENQEGAFFNTAKTLIGD